MGPTQRHVVDQMARRPGTWFQAGELGVGFHAERNALYRLWRGGVLNRRKVEGRHEYSIRGRR